MDSMVAACFRLFKIEGRRFVIPAEKVRLIRDQLDLCSIDERSLFPDLDGIAAEIKRYYSAGPEEEGNRRR
jgi:hypothetical protein